MGKKSWPHLEHAPIVEAVFDMRVALRPNFEANTFRQVLEALKSSYPTAEEIHLKGAIALAPSALDHPIMDEVIGFRLRSSEGTRLVQFRLDGFTFNQLKPYPSWEEFFIEAWKLWELYISIAQPTEVTRIALRYINRGEFPAGEELAEYIQQRPTLSPAIPADITAFLFHAQIKSTKSEDIVANVIQFTEPQIPNRGTVYVLDIDANKTGSLIPNETEQFKNYFAELRDFKNEIFFNTVTKKAIDLWNS